MSIIPLPRSGGARCRSCGAETWVYPVVGLGDGIRRHVHFDEDANGKWVVGPDGEAHRVPMSVDGWLRPHHCLEDPAWD